MCSQPPPHLSRSGFSLPQRLGTRRRHQVRLCPYGLPLELKHNGAEKLGGPLFWAQYSHIGLDPRNLSDRYANYWNVVRNHALSNYRYCVENPKQYKGYGEDCWGLTASYSTKGYAAHCPGDNDHGVITPTAALSSFPTHRRNPCVH